MTSNHLSHQSDRFHPWTLKFFTERETHCNLITASPGELSTWACGRQMKGEDCSSPCDSSSRHPGGKNELGKERRSHQSTSEEWLRGRGGHYFHQHPNLPSLVLSWHTCLPESDTYMLISGTSSNFNEKKKVKFCGSLLNKHQHKCSVVFSAFLLIREVRFSCCRGIHRVIGLDSWNFCKTTILYKSWNDSRSQGWRPWLEQ